MAARKVLPSIRIRVLALSTFVLCIVIIAALGLAVLDARYRTTEMARGATADATRLIQRQMQFVFDLGMSG